MADGGLSKARLSRVAEVMSGYAERGEVPGVVMLVSRHSRNSSICSNSDNPVPMGASVHQEYDIPGSWRTSCAAGRTLASWQGRARRSSQRIRPQLCCG
jgi:hypothetical protein